MAGYILSIVGIIVAGVFIDIIVPSGSINKYIRGIYSIFVVAVLVSPIMKFLNKAKDFTIKYEEHEMNESLLTYIYKMRASSLETNLEKALEEEGFSNIDIILNFTIEYDNLKYISCTVNLKNVVISSDKQHINKYEFIKGVVTENTNLSDKEIIIDEWKRKTTNNPLAWKTKKH